MPNKSLIFLVFASLFANEQNQEIQTHKLDKVITASGFTQDLIDAPASISIVKPSEIQTRPARDLGEMVQNIPGVSVDFGVGKTGGYGISIRGLASNYTLILIDGKRVNPNLGIFPNAFSEVTTSFMPPLAAIERIEVIRGPASTLYGSDAIGGVVNIILKKNYEKFGASLGLNSTINEKSMFGNMYGLDLFISTPLDSEKKWGAQFRLKESYRDFVSSKSLKQLPNISPLRNNIVGLSQSNIYDIGSRISYNMDSKNHFYFDISYGNQFYNNSQAQGLLGSVGSKGGYKPYLFFNRLNTIFSHSGHFIEKDTGLIRSLSTSTSLQYNLATNYGRLITNEIKNAGKHGINIGDSRELRGDDVILDHDTKINFLGFINATFGARYWFNSMHDMLYKAVSGRSPWGYQHIGAVFSEAEFTLSDSVFLTLGARGNASSLFGLNASPRAYLVYDPLDGLAVIKGGISSGYRTPDLNNLLPGVTGLTSQGRVPVYGNPFLKPESSLNYEISFASDNDYLDLSLTGFFTQFLDKLNTMQVQQNGAIGNTGFKCTITDNSTSSGGTGNSNCSYQVNEDRALSYGLEVFLGTKLIKIGSSKIDYNISYTLNKTEIIKGKALGRPLSQIPLHSLNTTLNYYYKNFAAAYLRGEFKSGIFRDSDILSRGNRDFNTTLKEITKLGINPYYKPYFLLHIGANFQLTDSLKLNLGIYNVLDHDFTTYEIYNSSSNGSSTQQVALDYKYIKEGRRYFASLTFEF